MNKQVSMGKRIAAGLIDIGVVAAASLILMCLAAISFGRGVLFYSIMIPIIYFFYMTIMELVSNGQTIGRMVMKLRVNGKNGKAPSSVDYIVRNIVKTMPVLIIILFPRIWIITLLLAGIYFLVPLVHSKNLAIHDIVGATVVDVCTLEEVVEKEKEVKEKEIIKIEPAEEEKIPCGEIGQLAMNMVIDAIKAEAEAKKQEVLEKQESAQAQPGLYGVSGMYEGAFIPLTRAVIMGRSHTCNLVFHEDAPRISRRHCSVTYSMNDDTFILTDMESTYGTYLGDNIMVPTGKSVLLKEGEEFLVGLNERFKVGKK